MAAGGSAAALPALLLLLSLACLAAGGVVVQHRGGPETCDYPSAKGDVVLVTHTGWARGPDEKTPVQIDSSLPNKPLRVQLGKGQIIQGLEDALTGRCVGQMVEALIPPHLAFDDPTKTFTRKPVPEGTPVTYKLEVIDVEHKPSALKQIAYALIPVAFILGLLGLCVRSRMRQQDRTKAGKKKGKAKKSR